MVDINWIDSSSFDDVSYPQGIRIIDSDKVPVNIYAGDLALIAAGLTVDRIPSDVDGYPFEIALKYLETYEERELKSFHELSLESFHVGDIININFNVSVDSYRYIEEDDDDSNEFEISSTNEIIGLVTAICINVDGEPCLLTKLGAGNFALITDLKSFIRSYVESSALNYPNFYSLEVIKGYGFNSEHFRNELVQNFNLNLDSLQ